jgi:hypothetical protein
VLGLGGWFAGALIVLTALPTVPLQDELLGALSVGVPVGLGLYFAWVQRGWSGQTKATGFAAAAGGALVGAWLGFNVTSAGFGLLAPFLAIVGAVGGGNLLVLALDVAWDRQTRDRYDGRDGARRGEPFNQLTESGVKRTPASGHKGRDEPSVGRRRLRGALRPLRR